MEQPKWSDYLLEELKILSDDKEHYRYDIIDVAANRLGLTEDQKKETISSGELTYSNRAGWALTYLKQSGLVDRPRRGYYKITNLGHEELKLNKQKMDETDLERFPGYQDFIQRRKANKKNSNDNSPSTSNDNFKAFSPDDLADAAEKLYRELVCNDLLNRIRKLSPKFFENLVVKLLLAMGYGDKNNPNSGWACGKRGDNGIDGIIQQDKFGFNNIYVQAKRYDEGNNVTPSSVRDFSGSLDMLKTSHSKVGVFITTSDFTGECYKYAESLGNGKIIKLINGEELTELMYKYGVGVYKYKEFSFKKIDDNFFDDENI